MTKPKKSSRRSLKKLAQRVEAIMIEELDRDNIEYDKVEARIYNVKTVGVQGDNRSYVHPTEIAIYNKGSLIYQPEFLAKLSNSITNQITDINRVAVLIKDSE